MASTLLLSDWPPPPLSFKDVLMKVDRREMIE